MQTNIYWVEISRTVSCHGKGCNPLYTARPGPIVLKTMVMWCRQDSILSCRNAKSRQGLKNPIHVIGFAPSKICVHFQLITCAISEMPKVFSKPRVDSRGHENKGN